MRPNVSNAQLRRHLDFGNRSPRLHLDFDNRSRLLLVAQVIPVADSLDAMTTARAYRPARSWDAALDELRRGAGTQWNPQVVEAAIDALAQEAPARSPQPGAKPAVA